MHPSSSSPQWLCGDMRHEHSVGSNTNNVWTPPLTVHSWHVTTKPLWWWGGWAHLIFFRTSLYMHYALSFVLVEHSVGSNTNNAWITPLPVQSQHIAKKPLWWGGWVHWIVFMTSLYMYVCIYISISIYLSIYT